MATFEKGILGGFSGKIGNVVGARWRGKDIMRSVPRSSSRMPTESQLYQRDKFRMVSLFLKPIQPVLALYFGSAQGSRSRSNLAVSYHLKEAVLGIAPPFDMDYTKVMFAKGVLLGLSDFQPTLNGNNVDLTWTDNSGQSNAKDTDSLLILTYNVQTQVFDYKQDVATRVAGTYSLSLLGNAGQEVHVWVAIHAVDKLLVSTSSYVGSYTI